MNSDVDKKTCARCSKKDCAQCVEGDGKNFCCQVCCDKNKKRNLPTGGEQNKEEPVNVCRFC